MALRSVTNHNCLTWAPQKAETLCRGGPASGLGSIAGFQVDPDKTGCSLSSPPKPQSWEEPTETADGAWVCQARATGTRQECPPVASTVQDGSLWAGSFLSDLSRASSLGAGVLPRCPRLSVHTHQPSPSTDTFSFNFSDTVSISHWSVTWHGSGVPDLLFIPACSIRIVASLHCTVWTQIICKVSLAKL